MISAILWIILGVLLYGFILEFLLDYLNSRWWSDRLPDELVGIYSEEKYIKSQNYIRHKQKFSLLVSTLSFIGIVSIISIGGFAFLDNQILSLTANPILRALLFFGVIGAVASILLIPFEAYSTFVIEAKYGFNTTSVTTFFLDIIKGWLLAIVIGGGLLSLVVWIYESTGNYFWLIAWGVITFFSLLFTLFYSNLIVPLFNKQRLLEEGELKVAIKGFAQRTGFKMNDIYIIDGSKRSKKANAYFTGFGKKRRIVLYDTLVQNHSVDELVAVLAHEIGHYKKRHTLEGLILSIIQSGIMLFILSLFIQKNGQLAGSLCQALGGFTGISVHQSFQMGILGFGVLYSPISMMIGILMNMRSRKNEFAADRFASLNFNPGALQSALKKLSVDNLSNLRPHPLYVFFYYSHPPLLRRLKAIRDLSST